MSDASQALQTVSLKMDAFVKGGLINDVDLMFSKLEFTLTPPPNYNPDKTMVFVHAEMLCLSDGSTVENHWSAGDGEVFIPAEPDHKRLLRVKDKSGLTDSSNFHLLRESFARHGFPEDKITDSLEAFEGMIFHGIRVAQPERAGLKREKKEGSREATVLVASAIIAFPWEKAKREAAMKKAGSTVKKEASTAVKVNGPVTAAAAAPTATVAAGAEPASDDIDGLAVSALIAIFSAADEIPMDKVKIEAFRALAKSPAATRNQVGKLLSDPAWLNAHTDLIPEKLIMMVEADKLVAIKS